MNFKKFAKLNLIFYVVYAAFFVFLWIFENATRYSDDFLSIFAVIFGGSFYCAICAFLDNKVDDYIKELSETKYFVEEAFKKANHFNQIGLIIFLVFAFAPDFLYGVIDIVYIHIILAACLVIGLVAVILNLKNLKTTFNLD